MFSHKLKELRSSHGLTQVELASKLNVSNGTIAMWETGKREPNYSTLQRIALFFHVSVDHLLATDQKPAFSAFLRGRLNTMGIDPNSLASQCNIDLNTLSYLLGEVESCSQFLSPSNLSSLSEYLNVDFLYLSLLYDGVNPSSFSGVPIPSDDPFLRIETLLDKYPHLSKPFESEKKPLTVADEGLSDDEVELLKHYRGLNEEGQEKAYDYIADLAALGRYKKDSEFSKKQA